MNTTHNEVTGTTIFRACLRGERRLKEPSTFHFLTKQPAPEGSKRLDGHFFLIFLHLFSLWPPKECSNANHLITRGSSHWPRILLSQTSAGIFWREALQNSKIALRGLSTLWILILNKGLPRSYLKRSFVWRKLGPWWSPHHAQKEYLHRPYHTAGSPETRQPPTCHGSDGSGSTLEDYTLGSLWGRGRGRKTCFQWK